VKPLGPMTWLLALATACGGPSEPIRAERWTADLVATRQVLSMTFQQSSSSVSGTGTLTALLVPGAADALTLAGTRRADTLDITFSRAGGDHFRFLGWYVAKGAGITGSLDGGEFTRTSVSFRRP